MGKDIAIEMEESEDDVEMNGGKPKKAKSSQAKVTEFFPNKKKVQRAGNGAVTEGQHGEKMRERKQRASAQSCEEHAVVKAGGEAEVPEHGAYPSCLAGNSARTTAMRCVLRLCDAMPVCVVLGFVRAQAWCWLIQAGRLKSEGLRMRVRTRVRTRMRQPSPFQGRAYVHACVSLPLFRGMLPYCEQSRQQQKACYEFRWLCW
jgi:hypothetical protein